MDGSPKIIKQAIEAHFPGSDVISIEPLRGGISATMMRVVVLHEGGERILTARFPGAFVRQLFSDAAASEYQTQVALYKAGLPVPQPLALLGEPSNRFLLMTFVPGTSHANQSDTAEYCRQMATMLARIHQVDASQPEFQHLLTTSCTYAPDELSKIPEVRAYQEALIAHGPVEVDPKVLRHGDFWPGNVVWHDGQISGVVDWENALRGCPIADLAISRLDIAWVFGFEAMEHFTRCYLDRVDFSTHDLPYWDVRAGLRAMVDVDHWASAYADLGRPEITGQHLAAVRDEFTAAAFKRFPAA